MAFFGLIKDKPFKKDYDYLSKIPLLSKNSIQIWFHLNLDKPKNLSEEDLIKNMTEVANEAIEYFFLNVKSQSPYFRKGIVKKVDKDIETGKYYAHFEFFDGVKKNSKGNFVKDSIFFPKSSDFGFSPLDIYVSGNEIIAFQQILSEKFKFPILGMGWESAYDPTKKETLFDFTNGTMRFRFHMGLRLELYKKYPEIEKVIFFQSFPEFLSDVKKKSQDPKDKKNHKVLLEHLLKDMKKYKVNL